jgi:hypothetical protein
VDIARASAQSATGRREVRSVSSLSPAVSGMSSRAVNGAFRDQSTASTNNLDPAWLGDLAGRLLELASQRDGWDSYGGHHLQQSAFESFMLFLADYRTAMQSAPSMSLTPEGGLHASWHSADSEMEITFEPDAPPRVLFEVFIDGQEFYGVLSEFSTRLTKWLWMSSMLV